MRRITWIGTVLLGIVLMWAPVHAGEFDNTIPTVSGGATGSDTAYNATTWDSNTDVPTKNVVRDKFETLLIGTHIQAYHANHAAFAGLTGAASKMFYFTGAGALSLIDAPTAQGQVLISGASPYAPVWSSSLSFSALDMSGSTSSVPWVSNNTAAPTVEGQAIWDADGNFLTIGDGAATKYLHPSTVATKAPEKLASFGWDNGTSAVTAEAASERCTFVPAASTITGYLMAVNGDPGAGGTILNVHGGAIGAGATRPATAIDGAAHVAAPTVPDNIQFVDGSIAGWTTAVAAKDIICALVATNAVATWITLNIYGTRN